MAEDAVPEWAEPRTRVSKRFVDWVIWSDGCDEVGDFIGWCPLCDPQRERDGSANFNFHKGVFRCVSKCVHPDKRAMSLDNLAKCVDAANVE